jgi:hypothetical protein
MALGTVLADAEKGPVEERADGYVEALGTAVPDCYAAETLPASGRADRGGLGEQTLRTNREADGNGSSVPAAEPRRESGVKSPRGGRRTHAKVLDVGLKGHRDQRVSVFDANRRLDADEHGVD